MQLVVTPCDHYLLINMIGSVRCGRLQIFSVFILYDSVHPTSFYTHYLQYKIILSSLFLPFRPLCLVVTRRPYKLECIKRCISTVVTSA
jgi:hypothetical protein